MKLTEKKLKGVFEVSMVPFIDNRGFLVRTFDHEVFEKFKINSKWVQESFSHTKKKYTLRGLHVSLPPFGEGKLITCIRGEMLWVVVDLRKDSETFGQWDSLRLSDNSMKGLYVQCGFAHGCISLSDNCDLVIKSDNYFSKDHGAGIVWNDKELKIDWQVKDITPFMSERDSQYQTFEEFKRKYGAL